MSDKPKNKLSKKRKKKLNKRLNKLDKTSHKKKIIVTKYASKLNKKLPKSEKWFNNKLRSSSIQFTDLVSNSYFLGYIPDYRSDYYKLIIEVDGSIHGKPEIQDRDKTKQKIYENAGYTVIRVRAYCEKSLNKCFEVIREIIESKEPLPKKAKKKLQKKESSISDSIITNKSEKSIEDQLKAISSINIKEDDINTNASPDKLISESQKKLLRDLGYKKPINDLSRHMASYLIKKLLNK